MSQKQLDQLTKLFKEIDENIKSKMAPFAHRFLNYYFGKTPKIQKQIFDEFSTAHGKFLKKAILHLYNYTANAEVAAITEQKELAVRFFQIVGKRLKITTLTIPSLSIPKTSIVAKKSKKVSVSQTNTPRLSRTLEVRPLTARVTSGPRSLSNTINMPLTERTREIMTFSKKIHEEEEEEIEKFSHPQNYNAEFLKQYSLLSNWQQHLERQEKVISQAKIQIQKEIEEHSSVVAQEHEELFQELEKLQAENKKIEKERNMLMNELNMTKVSVTVMETRLQKINPSFGSENMREIEILKQELEQEKEIMRQMHLERIKYGNEKRSMQDEIEKLKIIQASILDVQIEKEKELKKKSDEIVKLNEIIKGMDTEDGYFSILQTSIENLEKENKKSKFELETKDKRIQFLEKKVGNILKSSLNENKEEAHKFEGSD